MNWQKDIDGIDHRETLDSDQMLDNVESCALVDMPWCILTGASDGWSLVYRQHAVYAKPSIK